MQEEGLTLAKRNGELEAVARRLKAAARASEAEHQRISSRVEQLESELAREHDSHSQASQAASEQVPLVQYKAVHLNMLALVSAIQPGCHKPMLVLLRLALHFTICSSLVI